MIGQHANAELLGALSKLLTEVNATPFRLENGDAERTRTLQAAVADQLSNYVIPRLVQLDAPLLVVVGGSTGAGKSTLVNSLVGDRVTESGVLRPTTRSPVLVHHPDDESWFLPDRILPDLPRTDRETNDVHAVRLASTTLLPRGLAILDAPDVDSIDVANRVLATQLLAAADLWLFVTSAARYADQVPWDYLRLAAERSASVAVVLDRTAADAIPEVRGHLARMMTSRGLSDSPLFTVAEGPITVDGLLDAGAVAPIRGWLEDLAADRTTRADVIHHTLDGAIRHVVLRSHDLADAMADQVAVAESLDAAVADAFDTAALDLGTQMGDGSLVSGDVLIHWQEFAGGSGSGVGGSRTRPDDVAASVESAVWTLVVERAEAAVDGAARAWADDAAGALLLGATRGLDRTSRELRTRAERAVRVWKGAVQEIIRRRSGATQAGPLGPAGLTAALQVTAVAPQSFDGPVGSARSVLAAAFGDGVVDEIVTEAHGALQQALGSLLDDEQRRYLEAFDSPSTLRAAQTTLRDAARRAEYARHADFVALGLDEGDSSR